jgi:hypothetical protein
MPTESLSTERIEMALNQLLNEKSETIRNGISMLLANYRAPNRKISATGLARAAGSKKYGVGNIQYGKFAHRICDLTGYDPVKHPDGKPAWTTAICIEAADRDGNGHIQWILRPQTIEALQRLGLVNASDNFDELDDIAAKQDAYRDLPAKDRETVVKARIGQGVFRERIIRHWNEACAVTGCGELDLLIASHIKPWRACTFEEALDVTNGLLLIPNLDAAFDKGYITFDDEGHLVVSPQLRDDTRESFGISEQMRLTHIYPQHREYLSFHRLHVFKKAT